VAISDNGNTSPADLLPGRRSYKSADPTKSAFFWLSGFFVVYCARPEDWVPGLQYAPLAKITAVLAMWSLFNSVGHTKRKYKDAPKESRILLVIIFLMYFGSFLSPIWKGGALSHTMDFSKIYIAWILVFLIVTTFERLRHIIFIQAASVAVACTAALIKGHNVPRLDSVLGGIYSNPNDLAFAIVLALPFVLAFMITTKNIGARVMWAMAMLIMAVTLLVTASRAGFIDLVISGSVTLYFFGIKGKRPMLIFNTFMVGSLIMLLAGGRLYDRFAALEGGKTNNAAYGSYEARKYLMLRALDGIEHYPLFGLGVRQFPVYSLIWHDVHMTYLQICVEAGIPVLILYLWFFAIAFKKLKILRKRKDLDPNIVLFVGALTSSLVGFVVGALFAPEAYQLFPYFSVAFIATLLQTVQENKTPGTVTPPPKKPRHFLEVYADHGRAGAVVPVR